MANTKTGSITTWSLSSDILAVFRLMPEEGSKFPEYQAGQYIALRRNDCRLTKKVVGPDGKATYEAILTPDGKPKRGPVTHSYSISSAPYETLEREWLEFYVILELDEKKVPGRLTESMFRMSPGGDSKIIYYNKIAGNFTLDNRAAGFTNVIFVGTGTGLAPFVSMVKQLDHEAAQGKKDDRKYTLLHTNKTFDFPFRIVRQKEPRPVRSAAEPHSTLFHRTLRPQTRSHDILELIRKSLFTWLG